MQQIDTHAATAFAAVLGIGRFATPEAPRLKKELTALRRQIRDGAPDSELIATIRKITALRLRATRREARIRPGLRAPA